MIQSALQCLLPDWWCVQSRSIVRQLNNKKVISRHMSCFLSLNHISNCVGWSGIKHKCILKNCPPKYLLTIRATLLMDYTNKANKSKPCASALQRPSISPASCMFMLHFFRIRKSCQPVKPSRFSASYVYCYHYHFSYPRFLDCYWSISTLN